MGFAISGLRDKGLGKSLTEFLRKFCRKGGAMISLLLNILVCRVQALCNGTYSSMVPAVYTVN